MTTFSAAALHRIVACAAGPTLNTTDPVATLQRLVAESRFRWPTSGLDEFVSDDDEALWGSVSAARVLMIAGLVEIALEIGYLNPTQLTPGTWQNLAAAFRSFDDAVLVPALDGPRSRHQGALSIDDSRVYLFRRLVGRFSGPPAAAPVPTALAVATMDGFVNLTSQLQHDAALRLFLLQTHSSVRALVQDEDTSFLLSPRHFAAACATGHVGEKPVTGIEGGLSALRFLSWLADLLDAADPRLADDFVRHAHWAHSIERVSQRLGTWADTMSEWTVGPRDASGEAAWRRYGVHVFDRLQQHQAHLGIPPLTPQLYFDVSFGSALGQVRTVEGLTAHTDDLVAAGRVGAARRLAADAAAAVHLDTTELALKREAARQEGAPDASLPDWTGPAWHLLAMCDVLATFDDLDTAAAYAAPIHARAHREGLAHALALDTTGALLRTARLTGLATAARTMNA